MRFFSACLIVFLAFCTPLRATAQEIWNTYLSAKQAFLEVTEPIDGFAGGYPLGTCSGVASFGATDESLGPLITLALDMAFAERQLSRIGIAERLWRQPIANYEAIMLRMHELDQFQENASLATQNRIFIAGLAAEVDWAIAGTTIVGTTGCGDGGAPQIEIRLAPQQGSVQIMSRWNYLLCEISGRVPFEDDSCELSAQFTTGSLVPIAGSYHYFVRWSDDTEATGILPEINGFSGNTVEISPLGVLVQ